MNLLQICKRHNFLIIIVGIFSLLASIFYYFKSEAVFETSAEVLVVPPNPDLLLAMQIYYLLMPDFNFQSIINKWYPKEQIKEIGAEDVIRATLNMMDSTTSTGSVTSAPTNDKKDMTSFDINSLKKISIYQGKYPAQFYIKFKGNNGLQITSFINNLIDNTKKKVAANNKLFFFQIQGHLEKELVNLGNKLIQLQGELGAKTQISKQKKKIARNIAFFTVNLKQKQIDSVLIQQYNELLCNSGLVPHISSDVSNITTLFSLEKEFTKFASNYYDLMGQVKNDKEIDDKLYFVKTQMLQKQEQWLKEWELQNLQYIKFKQDKESLMAKIQTELTKNYINLQGQKKIIDIQKQIIEKYLTKFKQETDGNKIFEVNKNIELIHYTYEIINKNMPVIRSVLPDKMETFFIKEKAEIPIKLIWPNFLIILLIFILLGLPLNAILIFFIEHLDETVHKDKLKLFFNNIPELTVIPWVKQKSDQMLMYYPLVMESYRILKNNIKHVFPDEKSKVFTILSTMDGEGRTAVLLGLAVNFALSGKKVLIIDTNLRKPALHFILGLSNEKGLTSLFDGNVAIQACIQLTNQQNLEVITSGKRYKGFESETLHSAYFNNIIDYLKEKYDVIFLDTPSLNSTLDGFVITKLSDYVFLLIGIGKTSIKNLKILRYYAKRLEDKLLGYIIKCYDK